MKGSKQSAYEMIEEAGVGAQVLGWVGWTEEAIRTPTTCLPGCMTAPPSTHHSRPFLHHHHHEAAW